MKENIFVKTILSVLIPIVFLCIVYYLYPRIESFGLLFKETGNASIRIELIKQSLKMILNNPWGVGLNNFTKNLIEYDLPANLLGFIVPVHNTFLIFFTELGIPGGIFFTFFIFYIFLKNFKKTEDSPALFGVWIGIFTFIINSQIHPLFNLDPTFDILMLILGFYSICQPQKT